MKTWQQFNKPITDSLLVFDIYRIESSVETGGDTAVRKFLNTGGGAAVVVVVVVVVVVPCEPCCSCRVVSFEDAPE